MDSLREQLPGLLLETLHHSGLTSTSNPNLLSFSTFFRTSNTWRSHDDRSGPCGAWYQHLPGQGHQRVLGSDGHMGTGVVVDTHQQHAGTFPPDSGTKVSEASARALCVEDDVSVVELQC